MNYDGELMVRSDHFYHELSNVKPVSGVSTLFKQLKDSFIGT